MLAVQYITLQYSTVQYSTVQLELPMHVQCITSEGDGVALAPCQELVQPAGEAHELLHQVELVVCTAHHHLTKGL